MHDKIIEINTDIHTYHSRWGSKGYSDITPRRPRFTKIIQLLVIL
jgi:hypothetical protein